MKKTFFLFLLFSLGAWAQSYPQGPHAGLTPGSLCDTPTSYRYAEKIAYCERDVSPQTKTQIFEQYTRIGYRFNPGERSSYKIDHYLPLCAGGSNHDNNLWPQHITIYTITDPLEKLGCDKLKEGKITQKDLIKLIKAVKNDLSLTKEATKLLQGL